MKQKRAYKYRVYPTPEQKQILARTFGCARFVYNWALRLRTDVYYERQERIGYQVDFPPDQSGPADRPTIGRIR